MTSSDDHPMDPADVNKKAEEAAVEEIVQTPKESAALSPEEMRKTIHELQLQQIELKRQNEELRTGQTQVKAEESLREQRDFYESLIETAQTIILVLDTQGRIVRFNPYMEQLVGYTLDEVRGMDWFETFIKLENNDAIKSVFIKTVDNIQTSGNVNSIITRDGRIVHVEWSNKTLKDKYGRTVGVLAIGQDITERKQTEEALRESEERFALAMGASRDGIWDWNLKTGTIYCSPALTAMLGYDSKDVIQDVNQWQELIHPEDRQKAYQANMDCVNGLTESFEIEYRMQVREGGWKWILGRGRTVHRDASGRALRMIGTHQDITERKRIEQTLTEFNRDFAIFLEQSKDFIYFKDSESRFRFCSQNMANITGHANWRDMIGKHDLDVFPPDMAQIYQAEELPIFSEGKPLLNKINPYYGTDGRPGYVETNKLPIFDTYGKVVGIFGISRDITERKQAEEALKLERDNTRNILATVDAMIIALGPEGRITLVNRKACEILGYREDELLGQDWFATCLPHSIDVDQVRAVFKMALAGNLAGSEYYENPVRTRSGEERLIAWHNSSIRDKDGNTIGGLSAGMDITERKQAQLALEQKNQELEQFVYSVSHDLKSPLVTVKTFAGMLRQDIQDGNQQQIYEDLKYIDSSTDKMQQLLDALLKYSRIGRSDSLSQTLSADQSLKDSLAALAGILQRHQVQVSTSELPHLLDGDPMHFGQIWQNLIENAVKYSGDQPHPLIAIGATQQGQDLVFNVRDNGIGIAPEHNERIFNLFSQLTPGSEGSGLGLALVKKIVSIYEGRIWVESEGKGKGSCYYFTLPGALVKDDKTT